MSMDASRPFWWPLWGIFCACSWTWCIGMYLPRIMLDRHGWAGFLVFAIPNVIGCAALGYVLRTPGRARAIIDRHRFWALAFSFVTVAYHAFFVVFLAVRLLPADAAGSGGTEQAGLGVLLVIGLAAAGGLLSRLGDRGWLMLAAAVWLCSVAVLLVLLGHPTRLGAMPVVVDGLELLTLAPVTALGFLLCPYLDLTFLRAHEATAGTHAFGVFGAAFAVMLVLTCVLWYAQVPVLGPWALLHLGAQIVFTVGAHLRELRAHAPGGATQRTALLGGPFLIGLVFAGATAAGAGEWFVGEDSYMRFLAAYGLVFPAVVLLRVAAPVALPDARRGTLAMLGACVLCAPLFELAFIGRVPGTTLPAVIAALVFVVLRRRAHLGGLAGAVTDAR